jgi:hypothetical protein
VLASQYTRRIQIERRYPALAPSNGCPPNCGFTMRVTYNINAPSQGTSLNLPSCYAVEADVIANDLNPFSLGYSTATGLASEAAGTASLAAANRAAIYSGTQISTRGTLGLIQPLKSSTYRGMMAESSLLGTVATAFSILTVDAALVHAMYTAWNTPCD